MKSQERMRFLASIDIGSTMSVLLRIGLDLLFKFVCYYVVYKFYVYVKPRFCRKPVLPKSETSGPGKAEEDKEDKAEGSDPGQDAYKKKRTKSKKKVKVSKDKYNHTDMGDFVEDGFVNAAEKLLQDIKSRKSYAGSQTNQTINDLHARLKRMEKA